jgi:riboflavin biosynthesis pyrimidine reductase
MEMSRVRIVLDRSLRLSKELHLFDSSTPTIVFTEKAATAQKNIQFLSIQFNETIHEQVLSTSL